AGLPVALAHGLVVAQREEGGCSVADGALGDALCTELVSHLPNEEAVWNGVRHTVDGIAAPGDGDDHGAGASALRGGGEGEAGADWRSEERRVGKECGELRARGDRTEQT